ncbi:MAG: TRAP transporter substrate-binding protein [bacterium]|nr:MAG: TRAP transporter substrate-binding protein [bacterium]
MSVSDYLIQRSIPSLAALTKITLYRILTPLFAFFFIIGCQDNQSVRILKLAHVLDINHPVHKGMVYMAKKVSETSSGKMRVDIYPGGQLGAERDLIELLQIGSLAMTKVSTAPLEAFVPEMKIFGIPYVFRDDEHRWRVLNGEIGKKLLLSGEKYFLRGMCYYDAGSRSFYTKDKPIRSPSELRGLKIRVMKSITSVEMVQSLGGSATPIPWGELYTALQQGVVDGAENNPPSFYLSRHYEVCKYYSLDEHTSVPDILLMSTVVWNSLSAQEQEWLQTAVDQSVEYQKILWKESSDEALREVQKAGVEIIHPDKTPFRASVREMHESYRGTSIYDLIKEIENIQ